MTPNAASASSAPSRRSSPHPEKLPRLHRGRRRGGHRRDAAAHRLRRRAGGPQGRHHLRQGGAEDPPHLCGVERGRPGHPREERLGGRLHQGRRPGPAEDLRTEEARQRRHAQHHGPAVGHPAGQRQPVLPGHERGHRRRDQLAEPGRQHLRREARRGPRLQRHPGCRGRPRLEPDGQDPQRHQRQVRRPRPLPVRRQGQGLPPTSPPSSPTPGSAPSSADSSGRSRCPAPPSPTSRPSTARTSSTGRAGNPPGTPTSSSPGRRRPPMPRAGCGPAPT